MPRTGSPEGRSLVGSGDDWGGPSNEESPEKRTADSRGQQAVRGGAEGAEGAVHGGSLLEKRGWTDAQDPTTKTPTQTFCPRPVCCPGDSLYARDIATGRSQG